MMATQATGEAPMHAPHGNTRKDPSTSAPYKPLKGNEIRLAEIHSASSHNELSCSLLHVSQDKLPHYRALSYAWGDAKDVGHISVDGKLMIVRKALEVALRRLRPTDGESLVIWVDALCIDQGNLLERGEQVAKMQRIYHHAKEVLVWLGPECDTSPLAWQLVRDLYSCRKDKTALSNLIRSSRRAQFDALNALFRRPYWWRIWVVQEVTCAEKATVYCGPESISWDELQAVCDVVKTAREEIRDHIYHDTPASVFSLMRGGPRSLTISDYSHASFSEGKFVPLFELLRSHMSKLSTEPEDKVYGLVGISSDRNSFSIDYSRSIRSTYIYTARHIISTTQNLTLICLQQNDNNKYDLPSWVPDWERRNLYPSHRVVGLHIRDPPFKASHPSMANISFSENGEGLTAAGFVIDTISTAAQQLYVHGSESNVLPTLRVFHNWWNVFIHARGHSLSEHAVFQRTFLGGDWAPQYSEFEEDRLALFFGLFRKLMPDIEGTGDTSIPKLTHHNEVPNDMLEKREYAMVASAALRMHAKRFVISSTKLVGLAPMAAKEGDQIAILLGCDLPVVLREINGHWSLVGEIYVDGIMFGEAMNGLLSGKYMEQKFEIW